MFQRKTLCMCFVVVLVAVCAGVVSASVPLGQVTFIGPIFDKVEDGVVLCAQVCPALPGQFVKFHGCTIYGLQFEAGPVCTNSIGRACTTKIVPQGVYAVYATVCRKATSGIIEEVAEGKGRIQSCPVAVTVWADYANPPAKFLSFSECLPCPPRKATFGAMKICDPLYGEKSLQILYLDCYCCVKVTAKSYELAGPAGPDAFQIYGGCMFESSKIKCSPAHYQLIIQSIGGVPAMGELKITDFKGCVLYDTGMNPLADVNFNW